MCSLATQVKDFQHIPHQVNPSLEQWKTVESDALSNHVLSFHCEEMEIILTQVQIQATYKVIVLNLLLYRHNIMRWNSHKLTG